MNKSNKTKEALNFQPVGTRFYSQSMRREMMLVMEGEFAGWVVYKHPDGQWVTLRKATAKDKAEVITAGHRHMAQEPFRVTAETQSNPQPGSWYIHPGSPSCVRENDGTIVADHCTPQHARLIASAPDLIAALEKLLSEAESAHADVLDYSKDELKAIELAHAAIAQARGEK